MVKHTLFISALASLSMLLGCAGDGQNRSTGQVVDDATIAGKVKTALIQNESTKARDINVEVNSGSVQLSGFVETAGERTAAGNLARDVAGVTRVDNNLQVRAPTDRSAGQVVDDGVITTKVKAQLFSDARTKAYQINVTTYQGEVQLAGFVDSKEAKTTASSIAESVVGVKAVRNDLEVK